MTIDRAVLGRRLDQLNRLIRVHAGGVTLESVSEDGAVTLRFTGMCTGCPYKPVTFLGTVKPALLTVDGVTRVEAIGTRISAEAEARLEASLSASGAADRTRRRIAAMQGSAISDKGDMRQ